MSSWLDFNMSSPALAGELFFTPSETVLLFRPRSRRGVCGFVRIPRPPYAYRFSPLPICPNVPSVPSPRSTALPLSFLIKLVVKIGCIRFVALYRDIAPDKYNLCSKSEVQRLLDKLEEALN